MFQLRFIVAALCGVSMAASAQAPHYQVAHDTLRYEMDNPFRMYWVSGADTIGTPQHELSVESHVWSGPSATLRVAIRQLVLNVGRRLHTDTFDIAPSGRVVAVNHSAPTGAQRVDLLLQLPSTELRVGSEWRDTVSATGTDPGGAEWYEVIRTYHVRRMIDTLGSRGVADVAAEGKIRMRFGFWVDSSAGRAAWIDVTGPVTEQYLFDGARGRLLRRHWSMNLRGRGVSPTGPDTLPAGLRSEELLAIADSPRVRFLLAPIPGADTSVSVNTENGAAILLHTVARGPEKISSSLTRNDGLVGVAAVGIRDSLVTSYSATWADTGFATRAQSISIRGDSLLLARSGREDTTLSLPREGAWGIADYAMQELLAPVLLAIPRDSAPHPLAVFRPYAGHWDTGTATVRDRAGLVVVILDLGGTNGPAVLLFTQDGDYLFGENSDPVKARRVPVNAKRQATLQAAAKALSAPSP